MGHRLSLRRREPGFKSLEFSSPHSFVSASLPERAEQPISLRRPGECQHIPVRRLPHLLDGSSELCVA